MGNSVEGAGCFPLEKGQNAHVSPLRGAACGHIEAWSLVRWPYPARGPPPARAHPLLHRRALIPLTFQA